MKSIVASTGLLAAILTAPSFAADAVMIDPPVDVIVAQAFNWTGGYVGLQAGYLWGDGTVFDTSNGDYSEPSPDGWLGGIYVGYNYQMANDVVIGADADFAWTNADDFGDLYASNGSPWNDGTGDNLDLDWEGAVRLRLGYAVDRFLPYLAGGVAFGQVTQGTVDTSSIETGTSDDTLVGWTIGAGVEYAFTDNLIGRAEYRYTDFGDGQINYTNGVPGDVDLTTNDIRFGLAYKFY